MSLQKLWFLIGGYLIIVVEGCHIEKFINMTVSRGYYLWDIYRPSPNVLIAKVQVNVFFPLRHIARATGCKLRIHSKRGLPFASAKIRRRKMLFAGAVAFLVSLYILSSFIWSVEVVSRRKLVLVNENQILKVAADNGLERGTFKKGLDIGSIKEAIEKEFSQISWVGIEIRGTKATIEVVEKVLPDKKQEDRRPGNIVATKDGVIKEILVLAGEPKVAEGDTVKKGDILISGVIWQPGEEKKDGETEEVPEEMTEEELEPIYVRAKGIVRARVWYEARKKIPLVEVKERATGKSTEVIKLKLGDKEVILKRSESIPYEHYSTYRDVRSFSFWRNLSFPVELVTTTYRELERYRVYHSMAEAKELAEKKAMDEIRSRLPSNTKIVSRNINVRSSGEKEVEVTVFAETIEDIARFVPIKEK